LREVCCCLLFPVLFCDGSRSVKTLDPCLCNLELLFGLHWWIQSTTS
jgi:hypothetical protein